MRHRAPRVLAAALVAVLVSGCAGVTSQPNVADPPPSALVALGTVRPADDRTGDGFCAGVLIGPRKVLTAAHCLRKRRATAVQARVLDDDACLTETRRRARGASPVTLGDAAVVRLRRAVPPRAATPITVGDAPGADAEVVAWGWGSGRPGAGCVPRPVRLRVLPDRKCGELVGEDALGVYFCAVPDGKKNTCPGDSGGPVLDQQGRLVGITVAGDACGTDAAARYWKPAPLLPRSG